MAKTYRILHAIFNTTVDDDLIRRTPCRIKAAISLPQTLRADVKLHIERYAQPGSGGRLFVGPQGGIPRRRNFNKIWKKALNAVQIPGRWISICTTFGIPEAPGLLVMGRRSRNRWRGLVTPAPARP